MFGTNALAQLRRAHEWSWRGAALREARQAAAADVAAQAEQRARIALEVGQVALRPGTPWLAGSAEHLAARLFGESIVWTLRAHAARRGASPESLSELLTSHRAELLEAAGSEQALERLQRSLEPRDFDNTDSAEIDARELEAAAQVLARQLPPPTTPSQRLLAQRALRSGGLGLLVVALLVGLQAGLAWRERTRDLARGKPWRASSAYENICTSPDHECDGGERYFFHTQSEPSAWLEVDLTRTERFSAIKVVNRRDCCEERAVPLVVEVSNDHTSWQAVGQRAEPFSVWRQSFPTQTARWVRFRTTSRTFLHLSDVLVLR